MQESYTLLGPGPGALWCVPESFPKTSGAYLSILESNLNAKAIKCTAMQNQTNQCKAMQSNV